MRESAQSRKGKNGYKIKLTIPFKAVITNQSINHEALSSIAASRLNCYNNNAVRQSVKDRSDDEVWIRLSEEPCLEMLTE